MKKAQVAEKVAADKKMLEQQRSSKEVGQKYKLLLARNTELEREIKAVLAIRRGPKVFGIKPTVSSKKSESTAVIVASDWHLEEEVRSGSVNGLNEYGLDTFSARSLAFFQRSLLLIRLAQHGTTIKHVVLALLGDYISGNIHDELMETCRLLPAFAIMRAQDVLAAGIQFLLDNTDCHFTIPCTPGNHSRITKKQRHATEQGNSLETYMYHNLARHFQGNKRVTFLIADGYHLYLDVYSLKLRFHHGHAVRYGGGVGGLSIPLNKAINQWNKGIRADIDFLGHWHQFKDFGNAIVNGSMIGFNAFALSIKADYEKPRQTFCLIEKDWGKTLVQPIFLE